MKRFIAALGVVVLCLMSAPACAHARGIVEVDVMSDNGAALRAIPHAGYYAGPTFVSKKYLEATRGQNYSIVIRNTTPDRIGVVVAVDGRNIISGGASNLKSSENMYVLGPYESQRLDGWRTDSNTTHRFYFTDVADSYSVKTFGDASAMGVIAVAAFHEKVRYQPLREQSLKKAPSAPAPGAAQGSADMEYKSESAGTGFGDESYSPTIKVAFDPEASPFARTLIKYEWRETLCKMGLISCLPQYGNRLWDDGCYAPFPPDYRNR